MKILFCSDVFTFLICLFFDIIIKKFFYNQLSKYFTNLKWRMTTNSTYFNHYYKHVETWKFNKKIINNQQTWISTGSSYPGTLSLVLSFKFHAVYFDVWNCRLQLASPVNQSVDVSGDYRCFLTINYTIF